MVSRRVFVLLAASVSVALLGWRSPAFAQGQVGAGIAANQSRMYQNQMRQNQLEQLRRQQESNRRFGEFLKRERLKAPRRYELQQPKEGEKPRALSTYEDTHGTTYTAPCR